MHTRPNNTDTITAVSSPPGRAHRGLIRFTGDDTPLILAKLITGHPDTIQPRTLTTVHLRDPKMPAQLTRFSAPNSYTGQHTAELQLPGHPALLERILHQAHDAGARPAEPGEFTFRAFLAGKLDLTQAEGIAATISATSDTQLKAAKHLLDGELGNFARSLVDDLGSHLALVEAGIDFTDQEDVVPIAPGTLDDRLADLESQLKQTLNNSRAWSEVEALPRVVLVGAPSAGKSTLFNALLGRERAVIDPLPGTTRDVLSEPMKLAHTDGAERELMLIDVAGLDETNATLSSPSPIDTHSQAAANAAIQRADLIIHVIDPAQAPQIKPVIQTGAPTLTIYTKSDLTDQYPPDTLHVSASLGHNLDTLRDAIADQLGDLAVSVNAEMLTLQPRHESSLRSALEQITHARTQLADQRHAHAINDVELIAGSLRQALDDLAALGGQLSPDDVIGRVFATFCVGK